MGAAGAAGGEARYPTDRSKFFGASRCDESFLLCEDFESGSIDADVWKNKLSAPSIDSTRAARGEKSLHLKTTATGGSGLETSKIFPRPNGSYYGRMFVYFTALPTKPQWAHWTLVGANPKSGSGMSGEARVGGQYDGKKNLFGVGTDGGPTGDWTNLDADPSAAVKAVPLEEWICLEWMHDSANDISKLWWDGIEHPSLGTTRDVKHMGNAGVKYDIPDIASVWVGFWNYDQGQAVTPNGFDTWIDEVALDDERIGCGL
jgi:hypothetical protein